jgi:hypothetical protein
MCVACGIGERILISRNHLAAPTGAGVAGDQALQAMMDNMSRLSVGGNPPPFDPLRDYLAQQELYGLEGRPLGLLRASSSGSGKSSGHSQQYSSDATTGEERHHGAQYVLLRFDQPVTAPQVGEGLISQLLHHR